MIKDRRDQFLYRYELNSAYAAGYAAQQMLDREAGKLDLASYCQAEAARFARIANEYREAIREIDIL